jgi:hypothetical protein
MIIGMRDHGPESLVEIPDSVIMIIVPAIMITGILSNASNQMREIAWVGILTTIVGTMIMINQKP